MRTEEQKQYYDMAEELPLAHCYDLNVLAVNRERMYQFYTQHGILDGVAWHYVCDIKSFLKEHEITKSKSWVYVTKTGCAKRFQSPSESFHCHTVCGNERK